MGDDFARVEVSRHETREAGHGRAEHRTYHACDVPSGWPEAKRRKGLKRIGMAISDTVGNGKGCDAVRYHLLGDELSARRFGTPVRGRWGIEDSSHRQLDVGFGEDVDRTGKDRASANPGVLRRPASSLRKRETTAKVGKQGQAARSGLGHGLFAQDAVRCPG